jgi:NAD(P)-dependent dehydrogenase (short-subunit alcohol dehydrogenase family)
MHLQLFDLTGKTAVVTGGYGHLGRAMVNALADYNATVVVAGRSEEKFSAVFGKEKNPKIQFREIDILKIESIVNCFAEIRKEHVQIDILVNNACSVKGNSQENISDDDWNFTMESVVGSVHKTIEAVMPGMKEQKSGKIVNIASMYGLVSPDFILYKGNGCEAYTNPPHYGAAKAAMIQLTKYYAASLGPYNIQVNAIAPGPFPNENIQNENPEFVRRLKEKNPLNKIGKPEDLAGVIMLLSSSTSDFITGQTIQVDGGWTIW